MSYQVDTFRLATTYEVLAQVHTGNKDFNLAENYLFTALAYFQNLYKNEPWFLADFYHNITFFYDKFNLPNQVVNYSKKRLRIYNSIKEKEDADYIGMAKTYNSLGVGLQNSFKYDGTTGN